MEPAPSILRPPPPTSWQQVGGGYGAEPNWTFNIDDVALNDNTGAAQNSWCGTGRVTLILPTGDSARTGFLVGSAATTNLFDAVNNIPPTGVLFTARTATSQIYDATSNTTDNYQPTMQTYTAAGVTAAPVLIQPVCVHAMDNITSDSNGISNVSNPAIAEVTGSTGTTAAATWPTGDVYVDWAAVWTY